MTPAIHPADWHAMRDWGFDEELARACSQPVVGHVEFVPVPRAAFVPRLVEEPHLGEFMR